MEKGRVSVMKQGRRGEKRRRQSIVFLRTLKLNFIIVAGISICLLLLSTQMRISIQKSEEDLCRANLEYGLTQLGAQLDAVSDNIITFRELILQSSPGGLHRYDAVNLLKAQTTLKSILRGNPLLGEIAYVCENIDQVVTTQSVFYSIDDFITAYNIEGMDTSVFRSYLGESERLATVRFYPCTRLSSRYAAPAFDAAFCCAIPLDTEHYTISKGVAYAFLRLDELMDVAISSRIRPYASFRLYDNRMGRGDVCLMSYGEEIENGFETVLVNEKGTLRAVIRVSSGYIGAQMRSVNRFIAFIVLAAVLVGVGTAYWTAHRQYIPMQQVIGSLRARNLLISPDRDEYNELLSSVDTLITEKEIVTRKLSDYQESLQRNILDRLFSNTLLKQDVEVMLRLQMKDFPKRFAVYCGRLFVGTADSNDSMQMTLVMLLDYLKKNLPANAILHSTDTATFGLLYPCENGLDAAEETLQRTLNSASERFSAHVLLIRGGVCESMSQIGSCFEKAQMSYIEDYGQYLTDGVSIVPVQERGEGDARWRLRRLQALYQMMAAGNAERAVEEMREIYLSSGDDMPIDMRERYTMLRAYILMSCPEIQEDMACPEIPSFEPAMPQREQLESLERAVREVCTHVVEWETDAMDERVNTYVDYMEQHFDDPELCASSLANEFHVSEKYLFTLFKKKTGYSPTSYLHHIRMEKAAQLLRETDDTVQNISVQVGFANFGTFYKAFKREFGVAPGKFRAG